MLDITCPGCGEEMQVPDGLIGQTEACPGCGQAVEVVAPPAIDPARIPPSRPRPKKPKTKHAGLRIPRPPLPEVPPRGPGHRYWMMKCRNGILHSMLADMGQAMDAERSMVDAGVTDDVEGRLVGWLIRPGEDCQHVQHLDGLLLPLHYAIGNSDFLPPYDSCREDTCGCELEPVTGGEVGPWMYVVKLHVKDGGEIELLRGPRYCDPG
jgi:hypothetical protein